MSKSNKKHVSYLSEDIIIEEILTRLPVKSVVRFKSVSKRWYSTLSSSDFAKAHLMKSPSSHPSAPVNTLLIHYRNHSYLFSYDDDQYSGDFKDNLVQLDLDFVAENFLRPTGCCNGLICLTSFSGKYFALWNPATRKLRKYASDGDLDCSYLYVVISSGFGYVSAVDDYKYVRILRGGNGNGNICHIFSLRENKWRKIEFGDDPFLLFRCTVRVNDKLYLIAISKQAGEFHVSFDLGNEKFEVITNTWVKTDYLGVLGGRLIKCNRTCDKLMPLLEPPSTLNSICLPTEFGFRFDNFSDIVGLTKADKFFVTGPSSDEVGSGSRILRLVDMGTKPMQYTTLFRFDTLFMIARYFPSLVSPSPMVEEPSEA